MSVAEQASSISSEIMNHEYIDSVFPGYRQAAYGLLVALGDYSEDDLPDLYDPPKRHFYKDRVSDMRYLLEERKGKSKYYLSFAPQHATSSEHYHDGAEEDYYVIAGEVIINGKTYETGSSLTITSETVHQVSTQKKPGILLIHMRGVEHIKDEDLHVHKRNLYDSQAELARAIGEGFPESNLIVDFTK